MLRDDVPSAWRSAAWRARAAPTTQALRALALAERDDRPGSARARAARARAAQPPSTRATAPGACCSADAIPSEAYVAPIESGGRVVALLYADNLPGDRAARRHGCARGACSHEAGLALDRAAASSAPLAGARLGAVASQAYEVRLDCGLARRATRRGSPKSARLRRSGGRSQRRRFVRSAGRVPCSASSIVEDSPDDARAARPLRSRSSSAP